jgi:RNase adaptor protein for sRNA GlmZ degradation
MSKSLKKQVSVSNQVLHKVSDQIRYKVSQVYDQIRRQDQVSRKVLYNQVYNQVWLKVYDQVRKEHE